jgi:hypothetical protein
MKLNLVDDAGIFGTSETVQPDAQPQSAPAAPVKPTTGGSGRLNLVDDAGIFGSPEQEMQQIGLPEPPSFTSNLKSFLRNNLGLGMSDADRIAQDQNEYALNQVAMKRSQISGLHPAVERQNLLDAIRGVHTQTQEDRTRYAFDQAFANGLVGTEIRHADIAREHPFLTVIGQNTGALAGLMTAGGLMNELKIGSGVFQEMFKRFGIKGIPAAAMASRVAQSGATFGAKAISDKVLQLGNGETFDLQDLADIRNDTLFGAGLGAVGSIAKPFQRIPMEMLYGYTTSRIQGADMLDAAGNAALFGVFGLLNRHDLDKAHRLMALNGIKKTMMDKIITAGGDPVAAYAWIENWINRSVVEATGEPDLKTAWDRILSDPQMSVRYYHAVNEKIKAITIPVQPKVAGPVAAPLISGPGADPRTTIKPEPVAPQGGAVQGSTPPVAPANVAELLKAVKNAQQSAPEAQGEAQPEKKALSPAPAEPPQKGQGNGSLVESLNNPELLNTLVARMKPVGVQKTLRAQEGKKPWETLSQEEKAAEVRDYLLKDIAESGKQIEKSGQNELDFMVDRAMDHLDPAAPFYQEVLRKMGAEITPAKIADWTPEQRKQYDDYLHGKAPYPTDVPQGEPMKIKLPPELQKQLSNPSKQGTPDGRNKQIEQKKATPGYPERSVNSIEKNPNQPNREVLLSEIKRYLETTKPTYDEYKNRVDDFPELKPIVQEYERAKTVYEQAATDAIENEVGDSGYSPYHPWYYKDNAPIPVDKIKTADYPKELIETKFIGKPDKLQELLKSEKESLAKDIAQYQELIEKGADALSEYDKTISSNSAEEVLQTAFALVHNHISSGKGKIKAIESMIEEARQPDKTSTPKKGVSGDYALAGHYTTEGATEKDVHETGNLRPEKNFKKDLEKFANAVNNELGWDVHRDKKGKKIIAETNVAPVGGYGSFRLWRPGSEYGIYVTVFVNRNYSDDSLKIEGAPTPIMFSAETKAGKSMGNQWIRGDVPAKELAEKIKVAIAAIEINREIRKKTDGKEIGGGGSGNEAAFAKEPDASEIADKPMTQRHDIELPELVKLAKELLGDVPAVRKLSEKYGSFRNGKISLDDQMFKNPNLVAGVLGHEIGHGVDWIPQKFLKRGNLIGRLLSLKSYLKHTFGDLKNKEIKEELKAVTQYWNPFDENKNTKYTAYRYSSRELYAEAISVLLNNPNKLKELAPKFHKAFWDNIDKKPVVKDALESLTEFLKASHNIKMESRLGDVHDMYKRSETLFREIRAKERKNDNNLMLQIKRELIDRNAAILEKLKEAERRGEKINPEDNPKYALEEYNYLAGKVKSLLVEIQREVLRPIEEAKIDPLFMADYMMFDRIVKERADIANPLGHTAETAKDQLDHIKTTLGAEKFEKLEAAVEKFREINKRIITEAEKSGLIKAEVYKQIMTNPAYATFQVLEHIDNYITPAVIKQVGTLKDISNPLTATTIKMISTIRATERNNTRRSVVDFMKQHFATEIHDAEIIHHGPYKSEAKPKDGFGVIETRENGQYAAYYVDPYIADCVKFAPREINGGVISVLSLINSRYFRPVFVTLNLGFQAVNLFRDFFRVWKLTPDVSFVKMLNLYGKAVPLAHKRVWGKVIDPYIQQMEHDAMIGITYNDMLGIHANDEVTQMEYLLDKFKVIKLDKKARAAFLKNIWDLTGGAYVSWVESIGNFVETLPKVAGAMARDNAGLHRKAAAHEVRVFAGSPDFMRRGTASYVISNITLFANAIKEGMRGDFEGGFRNPRTRGGYMWKTTLTSVLPTVLKWLAFMGFFGAGMYRLMHKASDYDRTNYQIVPVGETENGKAAYFRIPQDESGRLISALTWKVLTFNARRPVESVQSIAGTLANQLPSNAPGIEIAAAWYKYALGQNPYDWQNGDTVLTDYEHKAGMDAGFMPMVEWTASKAGFRAVTMKTDTAAEKFVAVTPIVQRFIRITDIGEKQEQRETMSNIRRARARGMVNRYRK